LVSRLHYGAQINLYASNTVDCINLTSSAEKGGERILAASFVFFLDKTIVDGLFAHKRTKRSAVAALMPSISSAWQHWPNFVQTA
jgi:hypothetical protein